MLKSITIAAVTTILLSMPALALAQGKIAVLSLQESILNTDEAQKSLQQLRQGEDYVTAKKEFDELKKNGQALVDKMQKDGAVMNEEQKEELSKKVKSTRDDLEHVARKLQQAEKDLQQKLLMDIGPRVKEIVADLIKTEGIGLLLDRQAALHVDSSYSITPKVTDKLNQTP